MPESDNKSVARRDFLRGAVAGASALAAAFKNANIDVVVSALPKPRLASDEIWMNAAVSAGVKRIVPSEYSTNLENEKARKLPIVTDKVEIRSFVEGLAKEGKLEWTSVNNGPFMAPFVWLSGWMGPGLKKKVTTYHDGGEKIVGTTSLERIGEAVAKVLLPEYSAATKNQPVYVYSTGMSEKKMTGIVEKISGAKFEEVNVGVEEVTKVAFEAFQKGDMSKMMYFYVAFCYGEGYGGDFRGMAWNERLGLKEMTEAEIEEYVGGWLKK